MMIQVKEALQESMKSLEHLLDNEAALNSINKASEMMVESIRAGKKIFSCGNGGSLCDAMHFAEELTGRYRKNRKGYPAVAISDPSHLTCVANDFGYDAVFSRYIESHGMRGDSLVAISTSGTSPTVINAAKAAASVGMKVVGLTGRTDSELSNVSDVCIYTPGGRFADRVQELHIKVLHIFIEMIERHFHPELYQGD